ncbi:CBP4-domain-containing protein [Metschnikowia bicuspidata]|uniref:Cytochrome b mRNA-processing protein 4 n=1 Tax=Metschnikowia bicuspidata TaxID=27322 RepID=A0A4P9ZD10_9ASCO|nr:CBP4-domain-containing protein [Metschnikowia bicuspidata]
MSTKPLWYRWARVPVVGGAITGTGVFLYCTIIPTDEELVSRFSPEIRAHYERNKELRQKEQEELMRIVQQTAKSNDPIWKTGPITSPFEKDTRGKSSSLVNSAAFCQEKADAKRAEAVDEAQARLLETEQLVAQKKHTWWRLW